MRRRPPPPAKPTIRTAILFAAFLVAVLGGYFIADAPVSAAQDDVSTTIAPEISEEGADAVESDPVRDELIREGAAVYSQICSSCHQPGGAGLPGQFPPLLDNPKVEDTEYVTDVINNGLSGEIVVAGETFDGVMPSFSTLGDADTEAVIAYLQNDLMAPAIDIDEFVAPAGPVAGTELPGLANIGQYIAYSLAAIVGGLVLAPRLFGVSDRLNSSWIDVWLKTLIIVLAVAIFTVFIPDWALKTTTVAKLDRIYQDVIGVGLWAGGMALVLGGLWWAHRESRI